MSRAAAAWILAFLANAAAAGSPPPPLQKPAEIYHAKCEKCHGPDGRAPEKGEGLSFADGEWTRGSDLKSVVAIITNGVPETGMIAFKNQLSAAEIQALAKYIRSLDKNLKKSREAPNPRVARGSNPRVARGSNPRVARGSESTSSARL